MFYHNAVRFETFELAAQAAAVAARNGEVQCVERGSDHKRWTGFFRKYDPEFLAVPPTTQEAPAAPAAPSTADLVAIINALREEVASLRAEKAPKGRKAVKAPVAQTLPNDPLPPWKG
jgi:hypothetical protein